MPVSPVLISLKDTIESYFEEIRRFRSAKTIAACDHMLKLFGSEFPTRTVKDITRRICSTISNIADVQYHALQGTLRETTGPLNKRDGDFERNRAWKRALNNSRGVVVELTENRTSQEVLLARNPDLLSEVLRMIFIVVFSALQP